MGSRARAGMTKKRRDGADGGCERSAGVMAVKMRVSRRKRGERVGEVEMYKA